MAEGAGPRTNENAFVMWPRRATAPMRTVQNTLNASPPVQLNQMTTMRTSANRETRIGLRTLIHEFCEASLCQRAISRVGSAVRTNCASEASLIAGRVDAHQPFSHELTNDLFVLRIGDLVCREVIQHQALFARAQLPDLMM